MTYLICSDTIPIDDPFCVDNKICMVHILCCYQHCLADMQGECIVDFTSVILDDRHRGKCLFRQIVRNLIDARYARYTGIREIRVSSVLTSAMTNA